MANNRERDVVLNFKMNGQVQYAQTLKQINMVMNNAAKEYRNHIAAMGKDASATDKLRAQKQKLDIQMDAAKKRTSMLRAEYEAMANDTNTTSEQLNKMYGKLLDAERAELSLQNAIDKVNEGLSEQSQETRDAEMALDKLNAEAKLLDAEQKKLTSAFNQQTAELGENASEAEKNALEQRHLAQQMNLAERAVQNLEKQLDEAKRAYGDNSIEVMQMETRLNEARTSMARFRQSMERVQDTTDETERSIDGLKGGLAGLAGAAGPAAIGGLVSGMEETNQQLAMLEMQAINANLAMNDFDSARDAFASVGQDVRQTTEAMGNLVQAGFRTKEDLEGIAEGISGAIVKYGETFTSEGLAESINTTAQLSEVTGQLTDLLEKEGINVEKFNEKLAGMGSETERANYISEIFTEQGLTGMYQKYVEMNPEISKNAEQQKEFQDALSELSVTLTPLVTQLTDFTTKVIEWANENPKLVEGIGLTTVVIGGLVAGIAVAVPVISSLISLAGLLGIGLAPLIGIIAAVAAAIVGIILVVKNWGAITEWIGEKWDQFTSWLSETTSNLATNFVNWFNDMKDGAVNKFNELKDQGSAKVSELKTLGEETIQKFKTNVVNKATELKDGFVNRATQLKDNTIGKFNELKNRGEGLVKGLKDGAINKLNELKDKAGDAMEEAKENILSPIETAKEKISGVIEDIKGFFENLKLKIPKPEMPKMPKFSLETSTKTIFDKKITYPSGIGIKWNAKGGIFTRPTIFGMNNGVLQGAGEVPGENEAVLPLNEQTLGDIGKGIAATMKGNGVTQHITIVSPEPSSPSENARKMKQAARQLAMEW
ncbi:hypothetical protein MKX83_18610 [Cytobacillus sp. FSL M8-0252]|uniref:hypothetical protein n=1 Tax=Cytobacillus sp. FSL M8-0252 TaxID=2921621 RepID=UPI0030FCABBE